MLLPFYNETAQKAKIVCHLMYAIFLVHSNKDYANLIHMVIAMIEIYGLIKQYISL